MLNKIKGFVLKHKTKAILAAGSAAASMAAVAPVAFAEDQELGFLTNPVETTDMWSTLLSGGTTFINGFLIPVASFCSTNAICLLFLTATFIKLAVGVLKRAVGAFGRGR